MRCVIWFLNILIAGCVLSYGAYYCSYHRNQSVSYYMCMGILGSYFALDTVWRNVWTLWNHPELKVNFYMIFLQVGFWASIAILLWISIHPYAKTLKVEYVNYELHL